MNIRKILIVGYGSMGRRRIRLLTELIEDAYIIVVDLNEERLEEAKKQGYKVCCSLVEAIDERPDIAFVCTSPGHHADIIIPLIRAKIHTFTELNLTTDRYDEMMNIAKENNVILFMSSTMLYQKQMQIIKKYVDEYEMPLAYTYHVGQYLPDWHPWESYKEFFVGKMETNGVREILAIQLPWIIDVFGDVEQIHSESARCTKLDIDFPDSIITLIRHKNECIGTFVTDVVSRKPTTNLEIIGENLHLTWAGHNNDMFLFDINNKEMKSVKIYDTREHIEGYSDIIEEQPYRDEISAFLRVIEGKEEPRYSLEKDLRILSIIDKIETDIIS